MMNNTFRRTAFKYAKPANLAREPMKLPNRPPHPTRPTKSLYCYSTAAQERGDDPAAHQFHINKTVVYIFVPCALAMYGFLTYLSAEQGSIRQRLFGRITLFNPPSRGCKLLSSSKIVD